MHQNTAFVDPKINKNSGILEWKHCRLSQWGDTPPHTQTLDPPLLRCLLAVVIRTIMIEVILYEARDSDSVLGVH